MKKVGLEDLILGEAIDEMRNGLIDADLGSGLIKKRVPLSGRGKRGGARTVVATNKKGRWIFLFGFQKNERENVSPKELEALQKLSSDFIKLREVDLDYAVAEKKLMEVPYDTKR